MRVTSTVCAALAALALAACGGGGGGSGSGAGVGGGGTSEGRTLRIHVTDAPFPYAYVESASVVIEEVRVHERTSDAWTTVFEGSREIDLVPLTNGVSELLVEADIAPGTYDQVRLVVAAGEVVLTEEAVVADDRTFDVEGGDLHFPSGAQTGIKVGIENDVVVTTELSGDLVLDFDLSRNFVFNGPPTHAPGVRRVIFTPTVKATNASVAGSLRLAALSDALTPSDPSDDAPLAGATVRVFDAGADPALVAPVATASTDAAGVAVVSLAPGTYDVVVEAAGHEPATVPGATVALANLTDLGDVVLAATGEVSGTVMADGATPADPADDVVVEGATVEVRPAGSATLVATATTDPSGAFQVTGLAAGGYDLTISAPGHVTGTFAGVPATLGGGGATYTLVALTSTVSGTVSDADGVAVSGATASFVNAAGVEVATATSGDGGAYGPVVLATGTYTVTFTAAAGTDVETLVVVGEDPPNAVTLPATLAP